MEFFFFQAEDGIRDAQESRGLGDVYKRQPESAVGTGLPDGIYAAMLNSVDAENASVGLNLVLSLIHI